MTKPSSLHCSTCCAENRMLGAVAEPSAAVSQRRTRGPREDESETAYPQACRARGWRCEQTASAHRLNCIRRQIKSNRALVEVLDGDQLGAQSSTRSRSGPQKCLFSAAVIRI